MAEKAKSFSLAALLEDAATQSGKAADVLVKEATSMGRSISWMSEDNFGSTFVDGKANFTFTGESKVESFTNKDKKVVEYTTIQIQNASKDLYKISLFALINKLKPAKDATLSSIEVSAEQSLLPEHHNEEYGTRKVLISSIA